MKATVKRICLSSTSGSVFAWPVLVLERRVPRGRLGVGGRLPRRGLLGGGRKRRRLLGDGGRCGAVGQVQRAERARAGDRDGGDRRGAGGMLGDKPVEELSATELGRERRE